ncbi:MAG: AmmeMemoRadiSam system protein B [Candidatus Lernaella stagnicola]|nr:AmmeMemoRadiSam system protein B [Candidatus Lernaella stagnicola]
MTFQPVVAGRFYTSRQDELQREVDDFIQNASVPQNLGKPFGVIAPHAGYVFSGPVAGYSYRAAKGYNYDVVVVLGLSHSVPGNVEVLDYDRYMTPLGPVAIDRKLSQELAERESFIRLGDTMFRQEHSLEVQLPFIQRAVPDTPVVMVVIGRARRLELTQLAGALHSTFGDKNVLYVASTDLSHFRSYDAAEKIDSETLALLEKGDVEALYQAPELHERMCGLGPVTTLLETFHLAGGGDIKLLAHQNSGDTSGDKSRVVGYGSLALYTHPRVAAKGNGEAAAQKQEPDAKEYLTDAEKKTLLRIARETVEKFVRSGERPDFDVESPTLLADGAAFVTLHTKTNHRLRGCIGQIIARIPLWQCVRDMAVAAATQDPRFPAVRADELDNLHIEISVLTPPEKVRNVSEIEVGKHGLIMSDGWHRGLLLPQVPVEQGWDRETFLTQTCVKAGMSGDCWRDPSTRIERFSALVFAE